MHLGVTEEERAWPQRILLSFRVGCRDLSSAAQSEDLAATVDYAKLFQKVQDLAQTRPRRLLESFAEEVAQALLEEPLAEQVEVEVQKFPLPSTRAVSVKISRSRHGQGPKD
jgi:dihydroneopterin aldolase